MIPEIKLKTAESIVRALTIENCNSTRSKERKINSKEMYWLMKLSRMIPEELILEDALPILTKKTIDADEAFKVLSYANSFTRFPTFLAIKSKLKGKHYWKALKDAYTGSDNLYFFRKKVRSAFLKREVERNYLMNEKEFEYLNALPDQITLYRGMSVKERDSYKFGISWTDKREIAEYFAYTYPRNFDTQEKEKCVTDIIVKKSKVIAVFLGREEYEFIVRL